MLLVGLTALVLLALVGITAVVDGVRGKCFSPPPEAVVMLPLSGHREDVEFLVFTAVDSARRAGFPRVVLVDEGMDEDTRQLAVALCRRFGVELAE